MGINTDAVQRLYVAYFNRPSDPIGQAYWESKLPATAATQAQLASIAAGFSGSAEYAALYAGQSNAQIVNNLYLNLFGRSAEPAGLTSWANALTNGTQTFASIALQLTYSAQGTDATAIANKLSAANSFTNSLVTTAQITGYSGTAAAASARTWLATVTDVASTLASATATTTLNTAVSNATASGTSSAGSTFTLTTNADSIVGTSSDDTIGGTDTTLTALDSVNGGNGTDTLKVGLAAAYNGGATITGVERIIITQSATANFNATGITGLTTVGDNGGSTGVGSFSGLTSVVGLDLANTAVGFTATYADTVLAGSSDTVAIALSNVTAAAAVTLTQATVAANSIETVAITSNTSANSIQLNADATETSLTKVTVAGSANLTLALNTGVTTTAKTIDASAFTGNLTLSGMGAVDNTITGGTGNDVFAFAGNFTSTDVVNGGAGTDTLSATQANLVAITTADANVSNVETLMFSDDFGTGATATSANLFGSSATVTNIRVADQGAAGAAALTVNGIAAAATGASNNFRFDGDLGAAGGNFTFNITNATNGGTANAETLDMRGGATTNATTINTAGVETVTIDTTNATGAQKFTLADTALTTLTVKGGQNLDLSAATLGTAVGSIDATGLTGTSLLKVSLSTSSVSGATVNAANAGANVIIGSQLNDNITVGTGANVVTGGAGADTITFGAHTTGTIDTVAYSATGQTLAIATPGTFTSGTTSLTGVDVITGLKAADKIDLSGIGATWTAAGTALLTAQITTGTGTAGDIAIIKGNYVASTGIWTTSASGTDSLVEWDANGTTANGNVEMIVLVGFSGTASTSTTAGVITLA